MKSSLATAMRALTAATGAIALSGCWFLAGGHQPEMPGEASPDPVTQGLTSGPFPVGKSTIEARFGAVTLKLFIYKPKSFVAGPMLMVFHGVLRNAEEYRDHAAPMGERFGALIVAPLFDEPTFPFAKYQLGGILDAGRAAPPEARTGEYVNLIAREIRQREGHPTMPYALIGHSGGGQFLARLAAFVSTDAQRIVTANPGTYTFPTRQATFPYGYGTLPAGLQSELVLKAYLARPLTIYLGNHDTERDEYLDVSPSADAQGPFRFARGKNAFAAAKTLADARHWPFNWKLVIATGVAHEHDRMFDHAACAEALGWKPVSGEPAER